MAASRSSPIVVVVFWFRGRSVLDALLHVRSNTELGMIVLPIQGYSNKQPDQNSTGLIVRVDCSGMGPTNNNNIDAILNLFFLPSAIRRNSRISRNSLIWHIWHNWRTGGLSRSKGAHSNAKGRIPGHILQFIKRTKRTQGLQRKTLNKKVSNILLFSIALVQ
jgi:hypothetical protein